MLIKVALILFAQSVVDHKDGALLFSKAHEKVFRRNVSVKVALGVQELNAKEKLVGNHEDSFQGKFLFAQLM